LAAPTDADRELGVSSLGGDGFDLDQHLEALLVCQAAEDDVLAVELWSLRLLTDAANTSTTSALLDRHCHLLARQYRCKVKIELAGVRVRAGVHHGQHTHARVPQNEVLVLERVGQSSSGSGWAR
jgi:hypothetical protein